MNLKRFFILMLVGSLLAVSGAEARPGGGRSFGSRGSRGRAAPRYQAPSRSFDNTYRANPAPAAPAPSPLEPRFGGGGGSFMRGLAGGLAGGMIGSWLFGRHGSGFADGYGYGGGGRGFFGFFEILLLLGVAFLAFRMFRNRRFAGPAGGLYSAPTPIYRAPEPAYEPQTVSSEDSDSLLARYENNYSREAFQEARTDDFFRVQAAFMARDLGSIRSLVTSEVEDELERQIGELHSAGRINRLENITVRQTDIAEAWEEAGKLYATVHFKANLLDYVVDEKTGAVVSGSRTEPTKFEEYWTFVRGVGFAADFSHWRLSAIEQA